MRAIHFDPAIDDESMIRYCDADRRGCQFVISLEDFEAADQIFAVLLSPRLDCSVESLALRLESKANVGKVVEAGG